MSRARLLFFFILIGSIVQWSNGSMVQWFNNIIPSVYASTDPQVSTPSATATVPSFAVSGDTTAPTAPILISPTDGTNTNGTKPEFVWYQSSDSNSNTIYYTLHLNNVATYLGISNLGNSSGANYSSRLDYNQVKLNILTSLPDGTYDWYVTASDLSGNSRRSTSWRLTIDTVSPPLTLTRLDTLDFPQIVEGTNFDFFGPKVINFTAQSDPQIQLQLNLLGPTTHTLTARTDNYGFASFSPSLELGTYSTTLFATDGSGNLTFLPDFTLTLSQATLPIPGGSPLPIPPVLYDFPSTLTSLPSTIYQISTSSNVALLYIILLAVFILILLIILRKTRFNLILLNSRLQPLSTATIYHSRNSKLGFYNLTPSSRGRLYLPHLSRFSTLTIRVSDQHACTTHILSISLPSHHYTIVL